MHSLLTLHFPQDILPLFRLLLVEIGILIAMLILFRIIDVIVDYLEEKYGKFH